MNTKTRNTVKVKVQLMAVVEGNKPSEQTEHRCVKSDTDTSL